jgi:ABC-type multidrug transport system fused ATPase/permease subunit
VSVHDTLEEKNASISLSSRRTPTVKKSRRGALLIEPYKQLKFGIMFLMLNIVFAVLVLTVFGYYLWDIYQALIRYFQLDEMQSLVTLEKLQAPFIAGLLLLVLFILATLFFSVYYTHKIYGPLVSIRRFLDQLIRGESPEPIQIRSTDQLQDLVERLNKIAEQHALLQKTHSTKA